MVYRSYRDVESPEEKMHDFDGMSVVQGRIARLQADGTGMHHLPSNEADRSVSVVRGMARCWVVIAKVEGLGRLCGRSRFEMRNRKVFFF
jgi:hypothetical protein